MTPESSTETLPPLLTGLRVLDLSHQYSGALSAGLLADIGADVISVEHPIKSPIRTMLPRKGEHSMWWKVIQRGKRVITLDLSKPRGRELVLELARQADVICENFRPGTLERWGLGPEDLEREGINIVLLRISGFGQTGPQRLRPGFGTIAEAMSGFANLNGEPDGSPTFPSTTLADGVSATFGAFGVMAALWSRERHQTKGVEVVDMALFEGLFRLIPTQVAGHSVMGLVPSRPGNNLSSHGVLRDLFRSKDRRWFVISGVGPDVIGRILSSAGLTDLVARVNDGVMSDDPDSVKDFLDVCVDQLHQWALAHDYEYLENKMNDADAVYQTVYTVEDIVKDPQFQARGDLIDVPDNSLGDIQMQGVIPKFPRRTHEVHWAGRDRGADNDDVFRDLLHLDKAEITELRDAGII
jgi:crotonobetainyl-CoA:carnitine CoA-transferase CaiB-like acyl-CoA transferase